MQHSFIDKPSEEDRAMFEEFAARRPIPEIAEGFAVDNGTLERVLRKTGAFYRDFCIHLRDSKSPKPGDKALFDSFVNGGSVTKICEKYGMTPGQAGTVVRAVAKLYLQRYRALTGYNLPSYNGRVKHKT